MAGWNAHDIPDQSGRTAVVTGANGGLGYVTARELARKGARVVLACRSEARGKEAVERLALEVPHAVVELARLDLGDLASVREFAAARSDGRLDLLLNNAGVMAMPYGTTVDGFETQFGVNHLGPFALTNLLLPQITDRVVTVSSLLHRGGTIDFNDLNWRRRKYGRSTAYAQSKLANLLFGLELQRRLTASGSSVRSVMAHPGYARTNLQTRTGNAFEDFTWRIINRVIAHPPETGALPSLFAVAEDIPGGSFVGPDGRRELGGNPTLAGRSRPASDVESARRLWLASEELTGARYPLAATFERP